MSVKNVFKSVSDVLDQGWFSRGLLVVQFVLAFQITTWSWAFASTALAMKVDLMGVAATIAAVAAAPQAILMFAANNYVTSRNPRETNNS